MQKELNPELFGTPATGTGRFRENEPANQARSSLEGAHAARAMEEKVAELRSQLKMSMDQVAHLVGQVNEYIKTSQGKFSHLQTGLKTVEAAQVNNNQEVAQRLSHIHQRINERKAMDQKMQEMIDRHNSILRTYEVRMNHLQKLLAEKETLLVQSTATLNEARMEIARLKRL